MIESLQEYAHVDELVVADDPPSGRSVLEFKLMYKGKLKAEGSGASRPAEKHMIRRQLHKQLRELWRQSPLLNGWFLNQTNGRPNIEFLADRFARCGNRFLPLVREEHFHSCALDILFLRRDGPGSVIQSGGDIDNRVKVIFDALRIPDQCSGVGPPEEGESPFFCLLQDDRLITEVKVTTERLLMPIEDAEHVNDVFLLIGVSTRPIDHRGMFQLDLH